MVLNGLKTEIDVEKPFVEENIQVRDLNLTTHKLKSCEKKSNMAF